MQTLIAFLAALTLLIFVHELGHYLAARYFNVKVLRFSIGFGKSLLTWRVGPDRTEWTLAAIPLGGYVRMLDERDQESGPIPAAELPRAFTRQSLKARSVIVAAGPFANFLLAVLLYAMLGWIGVQEPVALVDRPVQGTPAAAAGLQGGDRLVEIDGQTVRSWQDVRLKLLKPVLEARAVPLVVERGGEQRELLLQTASLPPGEAERDFLPTLGIEIAPGRVEIGALVPDGAAMSAGLIAGDRVLAVNGQPIARARELIEIIRDNPGATLAFTVERDGAELRIPVAPAAVVSDVAADNGRTIGRIGANLRDRVATENVRHGPFEAIAVGAEKTWQMSVFSLQMLGKMITGELSVKNLSGPVTIADLAGQTAEIGWFAYVSFLALISISLGVLNLLPIPVLDGGHLVYYAIEGIRGRPLSDRMMDLTQRAGVGLILMMMVVALFNDITRLIGS